MAETYGKFVEEEVRDKISRDLEELSSSYPTETSVWRPSEGIGSMRPSHQRHIHVGVEVKSYIHIDLTDIFVAVFALLFFALGILIPEYQIGLIFAFGLAMSILTRSPWARAVILGLTASYFLLSILLPTLTNYISIGEIFNFIFGINTISYVPFVIGTLMAFVVMGSGIIFGLSGSTKLSGVWVIGLSLILAIADTLVAVYDLAVEDWVIVFWEHLTLYVIAFIIAWGVFYGAARLVRAGIVSASR